MHMAAALLHNIWEMHHSQAGTSADTRYSHTRMLSSHERNSDIQAVD